MKRKPLSIKKLVEYLNDYLFDKYKTEHRRNGKKIFLIAEKDQDKAVRESKKIKNFLDYIWKNPK